VESLSALMGARRICGSGRRIGVGLAFGAATMLIASCAHSTGGSATSAHTTTSSTAASEPHTGPAAAPAPPPSDEVSAKQTVTVFNEAYDSQNWEAYTEVMCAAMRAKFTGVVMDYLKKGRIQNGLTTIKSMTVAITGDTAVATIDAASEGLGAGTIKLPLKREDGWKVCELN
jgi:ABC-type glycerol-3-phosphate transport system substrate-binding protein